MGFKLETQETFAGRGSTRKFEQAKAPTTNMF